MRVLFVDDNQDRFEVLRRFTRTEIEIVWAKTSYEAIRILKTQTFDVVCLDHDLGEEHTLPTKDGMDIVYWVIDDELGGKFPWLTRAVFIIHSWNSPAAGRMRDALDGGRTSAPFVLPFDGKILGCVLEKLADMLKEERVVGDP